MLQPSLIKEWNWSRKSFWTKLIILANAGGQLGKYFFFLFVSVRNWIGNALVLLQGVGRQIHRGSFFC
jgi:hypothetical protein